MKTRSIARTYTPVEPTVFGQALRFRDLENCPGPFLFLFSDDVVVVNSVR